MLEFMTQIESRHGWPWALAVAVLAATASAQSLGLFSGGAPSVFAPCPLPFVLIAWSPVTPYGVPVLVAIFALAWCAPLFRGRSHIPARTPLLAWLVGLTSFGWFASAAVQRLNSDGAVYTIVVVGASLVLGASSVLAIRCARKAPSLRASAIAHACLLVWFVSYAYPWFGEVP